MELYDTNGLITEVTLKISKIFGYVKLYSVWLNIMTTIDKLK